MLLLTLVLFQSLPSYTEVIWFNSKGTRTFYSPIHPFLEEQDKRDQKKRKVVRSDVHSFFCSLFRDIVPSASKGRLFYGKPFAFSLSFFSGASCFRRHSLQSSLSTERGREAGKPD